MIRGLIAALKRCAAQNHVPQNQRASNQRTSNHYASKINSRPPSEASLAKLLGFQSQD